MLTLSAGNYECKTKRHVWFNREDAEKCCNGYKRILVVDSPNAGHFEWMQQPPTATAAPREGA